MIAAITAILLLALLLFLPLTVQITFSEKLDLNIKIFNIKIFEYKKLNNQNKKSDEPKENYDVNKATDILSVVKSYFEVVCEILKILYEHLKRKLIISKFAFSVSFGFDDAASTGIFSGAVYTLVNVFYAYILNNFKVRKHNVQIQPDFNNKCFDINFLIKFNISLYWIICLLFKERKAIDKLLKIIKKDGAKNE